MKEWFEDDKIWESLEPILFPEKRISNAVFEVQKVIELSQKTAGYVLDLCCGVGRHSICFAKLGWKVTAVDRTHFYIEKAKKTALVEKAEVEWVVQDSRTFVRPRSYDLIINMFSSFGYSENQQDDIAMLKNIHKSLKSNGVLVMEMAGKENLLRNFQPTVSETNPDGTILVQRHKIKDDWGRINNHWLIIKGRKSVSLNFDLWIYSGQELKMLLSQAGFSKIKIFGDLDGNEYGINAKRLVIAAFK